MTGPSQLPDPDGIRAARLRGRLAATLGQPVTANPYAVNGDDGQQMLARGFIRGYLDVRPLDSDAVDYTGDE